ncbi:unnamed protein product [Calypogeia fissa]
MLDRQVEGLGAPRGSGGTWRLPATTPRTRRVPKADSSAPALPYKSSRGGHVAPPGNDSSDPQSLQSGLLGPGPALQDLPVCRSVAPADLRSASWSLRERSASVE